MFAKFEYRLSKDEYVKGLKVAALALAAQDRWRSAWCFAQLGVIGVAIFVATRLHLGSVDGFVLTWCLIMVPYMLMQVRFVRRWRELTFEPETASRKLTFDADGVIERHDLGEWRWPWIGVRRVYDLPDALILQVAGWHLITLPNRLWPTPHERTEFVKRVRDHATSLLPDLRLQAGTGSNLLTIGAIAGAVISSGLVMLLTLAFVGPIRVIVGHDVTRAKVFGGIWVILALTLAVVVGRFAKIWLERLKKRHSRLASFLAAILLIVAGASVLAFFLLRPCSC